MKKIKIFSHAEASDRVLEVLYDRGFIEVVPKTKTEETKTAAVTPAEHDYELAKVKYALEFLEPLRPDTRSPIEKILGGKKTVSPDEVATVAGGRDYFTVAEEAEKLSQRLNSLKNLAAKLAEEKNALSPWREMPLATGNDCETARTKASWGTISAEREAEFLNEWTRRTGGLAGVAGRTDAAANIYAVCLKEKTKAADEVMAAYDFKTAELPELNVKPAERIAAIEVEAEKTRAETRRLEAAAAALAAREADRLRIAHDYLFWRTEKDRALSEFDLTVKSAAVTGWIKADRLNELKGELEALAAPVEIIELEPEEGEEPPIVMDNPRLISPLEFVTNIYGYPKYGEIDPTPFLAGFFIIFFGLCLTDAGYGLALAVTTALALKFLKFSSGFRKLLKVLFYGSILTFIAGGLTGGWFGIVLDDLVGGRWDFLARPLLAIRRIDPVNNPITMLVFSLILGYLHLLFGNGINLWWKIKHGDVKAGLLGPAVWMYFLATVGFWIVADRVVGSAALGTAGKYLLISSLLAIVLTQGKGNNIFARIPGGLASLYFGLSGYVSDILSYSRLLALGLATGIIGMVINIIGTMLNDMIPYVGWIFMILILVAGHLMNLVISLVGAFIHSGRLQYVEFFKTFFDGGGREFSPLLRQSKYVVVSTVNSINKK